MGRSVNPTIEELPSISDSDGATGDRWIVTVYNNDTNTYDEVITILIIATDCSPEEAWIEAWEIDHLGFSVVHCASEDECITAAEVIATIGIRVEVQRES